MRRILMMLTLLAAPMLLSAQSIIKGVVKDDAGEPVIGATVREVGTSNGTVTDFDGKFELKNITKGEIQISFVGFLTQKVSVKGKSFLEIKMENDQKLLDEVVVVGYGTMRKSDVTGAVSRANIQAFEKSPNTNLLQSLQGTVPGLNVGQASSAGSSPELSIRGANTISGNTSVLIILDGIIFTGNLSSINPADIESVDVLKDASATAVYGAQAANGVLLITSKKGAKGKAKVSFSSSYSFQTPTKKMHTMNRSEMLNFDNECLWQYSKTAESGYTQQNPNFKLSERMPDAWMTDDQGNIVPGDYDWWSDFTRNGSIWENKMNISGGSDAMSYLISLGNTKQKNYLLNDDYSRNSIRVNLDIQPVKWLKAGVQAFGSFENRDGQETYLPFLIECSPLTKPYDENGDMIHYPAHDARENPYHGSLVDDYDRSNSFFANLYTEVQLPLKGLTYRLNFGNNYRIGEHNYASEFAENNNGQAYKHHTTYYDYTLDNILNYMNDFGKHSVGATLVYGASRRKYSYTGADAKLFPRMTLGYNSLELASTQNTNSDAWLETLLYQMARVNYSYDGRYLLTATVRRDGYSGFSANNKSAVFPSVALGWVLTNEEWFKVPQLDYLKLRAGWGMSGNQTSRYSSLARVNSSIGYIFGDGVSGSMRQELASMENANLKWEKTAGFNFGIDFALLNNRISGTFDTYWSRTKDLLLNRSIPTINGTGNITENRGKTKGSGWELQINSTNIVKKNFTWTSTLNLAHYNTEIVDVGIYDEQGNPVDDVASRWFIGEPISVNYDYKKVGIWQITDASNPKGQQDPNYRYSIPGYVKVDDKDGQNDITPDDMQLVGSAVPWLIASLSNSLSYKGLTLTVFLNSEFGRSANNTLMTVYSNSYRQNRLYHDFWTPENPTNDYPMNSLDAGPNPYDAGFYEDAWFVRLQNVNLSYNLPSNWLKKIRLSRVQVYVDGKNLKVWTPWKGLDPEFTSNQLSTPPQRSISFGLKIDL